MNNLSSELIRWAYIISFLFDSGDRDFMRYGHKRMHAETKSLTIDAFLCNIHQETYTETDRA